MSKYQTLIDALAGVDGKLGQPSLHSGHVIYAETEEWCSVDINVKLSANRHISGPLARFIKEAANPSTIRALLADLDAAVAFIDDLRQDLHSRRVADWYPEGAHNAAEAMSEDMRRLGNRCADFEVIGNMESAQLPLLARSLSEWHEDDGTVVWWAWNGEQRGWAGEAAYIGSPLSDDWPGYHTHWTPHPKQPAIDAALAQMAGGG